MALDGIKKYFSRHVHRRIHTYTPDDAFMIDLPETHSYIRRRVETFKLEANIGVNTAKIELHTPDVRVKGLRVKIYTKQDVKIHAYKTRNKINVYSALKQLQAMPQERVNIIKLIKNKPSSSKNEIMLACYYPVVEGAVLKLALNKQRGTLLVWYNPGSRQLKARSVYLIRRLGLDAKTEWRWV